MVDWLLVNAHLALSVLDLMEDATPDEIANALLKVGVGIVAVICGTILISKLLDVLKAWVARGGKKDG